MLKLEVRPRKDASASGLLSVIDSERKSAIFLSSARQSSIEDIYTEHGPIYGSLETRCSCRNCQLQIIQRGILHLRQCPVCNHLHYHKKPCSCVHHGR